MTIEWIIINKTLEAADKAHPPPPPPVVKPTHRIIPHTPASYPSINSSAPASRHATPTPTAQHSNDIPAASSSSRPMIKLKVGSQSKNAERPPQQPAPKPKKSKAKPSDSPTSLVLDAPPPYVDDGSHDILQEVLAIEREKNEQRQRSVSEKDKPITSISSGKRKKSDLVEDDILALAAPSKKERPSPAEPSTVKHQPQVQSTSSVSKSSVPSIKFKKDKSANVQRPYTEAAVPSVKGKEREIQGVPSPAPALVSTPMPTPAVVPAQPKRKNVQTTPINEKKCKELLKLLTKVPEAEIFMRPVDPLLDGCPTYVRQPLMMTIFASDHVLTGTMTKFLILWILERYQGN